MLIQSDPNFSPPQIDRRNFDAEAAQAAFRERSLKPLWTHVESELQAELVSPAPAFLKTLPEAVPIMFGITAAGLAAPPVMLAVSGAIAIRYAFFSGPRLRKEVTDATDEITGNRAIARSVDRWLDKHIDRIPDYLDRLDRREDDLRARERLLTRLAQGTPLSSLAAKDRELLKRYDSQKFKTRAENPFPLKPHQSLLGNWHNTQIYNAMRRDIKRTARQQRPSLASRLTHSRS